MMATSLLERLMGGTEETRSILVQDSSQCNGRLLLKAIALQSLERFSFVHLFLFDVHSQFWLSGVPLESVKRLTVHDCYSDHLGWNSSSQSGPAPLHEATPISFLHRIERTCGQATPTTKGMQSEYAIIIDSLSTILEFHSTSHICRLVHQLGGESRLIVCLLHSDVHESHVTSQLSHVISTTITLTPPLYPGPHWQARLQYCKISGKLLVQTELVSVSGDYTVKSLPSGTNHSHLYRTQQVPPDPAANLTFDLTLSDREKEERSRLALPYHHSAEQKTALLSAGSSSGKIFYQPDEADDFDDSDPDDDLDL